MKRVTLDTNTLPADDLLHVKWAEPVEFAFISVTERETAGTSFEVSLKPLERVDENVPYGSGPYGAHTYGGTPDPICREKALEIIGSGSFPPPENRTDLTAGQRRQLLDALILCTHVRDKRDIFLTNDKRAFIARKQELETTFKITIMTRDDFVRTFSAPAAAV